MPAPLFPVGEYSPPESSPPTQLVNWIDQLEAAPVRARESVQGLEESQLDCKYRNWTIRQIIHHLADSHINCYVRFKWALTEDTPRIKSYDETSWSEVVDAKTASLACSLTILDGVHARWVQLLRSLDEDQWQRGYFHPEVGHVVKLIEALPNYVWHVDHHLGQIAWLRRHHGWNA